MNKWHVLAATALAGTLSLSNAAFAQDSSPENPSPAQEDTTQQPAASGSQEGTQTQSTADESGQQAEGDKAFDSAEIIALPDWHYDELYADGTSVEEVLDAEVVGPTGEEIGDVENVIFDVEGNVLSVIAEIGGFLEMGDTHLNVPWDQVEVSEDGDTVEIPVTQEAVEEYTLFNEEVLAASEAASDIQAVAGDNPGVIPTGPRAWRAAELIGDYARLKEGDGWVNYGYIDDLILRDGKIAAVLVDPDVTWGEPGPYAYPYYGYAYGWYPGLAYYDLPYAREEVGELEPFDEAELDD